MSFFKLVLKPGIDKQNTEYGAEGGWIDCDNVRFRYGLPEKIGGWRYINDVASYLVGYTSDIFTWSSSVGSAYAAVGTNLKLYIYYGGGWYDITPIESTTAAGDVTFAATTGSPIITVTDVGHGARDGTFVTFSGATSLGGNITDTILNSEYEITSLVSDDVYTITAPVDATASDTGNGGASIIGEYQINPGSAVNYADFGFGTGTWGGGTWGAPRVSDESLYSRIWTFDYYGEDLVCQLCNGKTYYWDTSAGVTARAVVQAGAPTYSRFSLVSTPDRHLVCFGTETTIGDPTTLDNMFVRFSDQENISDFIESATNTAGGQRLTDGNRIVSAIRSRGQILIFTDTSLHAQQYVGPPYTFGFQQLGANCGAVSAHSSVDVDGIAFWMGQDAFYAFDGTVKKMPCTVQDYVFQDINIIQGPKVFAAVNSQFNEITWFYCSFTSDYIDRSVTYNYMENIWAIGSLARTAWADRSVYNNPIASKYMPSSTANTISTIYGLTAGRTLVYNHESGVNDVDAPLEAYIESGYFDIGDGDSMLLMSKFIPDFKNQVGDLTVNLFLRPYPQATASPSSIDPYVISPSTQMVNTRARGRQVLLKITSDELDSTWRFGTLRVDVQPDGLR